MKLSVVILNYNVLHFLELCIKSVEAALVHIDSEIIVVDNLSKDDSCAMVKRLFPNVKLIENSQNFGFSKGNNIAVRQAQGEYLCILNPDTVVAEDTFERILEFADTQKNAGIIGCRLVDGHGAFLPESKREIPTPNVAIKKILGYTNSYYTHEIKETEVGLSPIFVGAFMCVKKAIYEAVKGFDEDYFMYGEDIDFSYKVHQLGYENIYFGETSVVHYKGESTLRDAIYAKRFYGAMQIFYSKHFKSNALFDAWVALGIKLVPLFQKTTAPILALKKNVVFVSSEMNEGLNKAFEQGVILQAHMNAYNDHTEYVLDNNYLSFKSIIEIISSRPKYGLSTFKILPKNSNFIIGSDSSKTRGEVIPFNDN